MNLKTLSSLLVLLVSTMVLSAADPIEGTWEKSDKQAVIKLTIEDGKLVGRIVSVAGKSRTHDTENPDAKLRKRKLIGMPIVWGFTKSGKEWTGGTVYDSSKGKNYQGKIWMEGNDKVMMRGFVGVSLIGRSAEWNRVK